MQELGIRNEVVQAILNHAVPGVGGVYLRSELEKQKAEALAAWAAALDADRRAGAGDGMSQRGELIRMSIRKCSRGSPIWTTRGCCGSEESSQKMPTPWRTISKATAPMPWPG